MSASAAVATHPRRLALVALVTLIVGALVAGPAAAAEPLAHYRVALIVGPAGEQITPWYLSEAERIAVAAEAAGAEVARAYSPRATPERVLEAVAGAQVIVYFGHGNGFPNPYGSALLPDRVDGWALQGPMAVGTHADRWQDDTLRFYGESWILAHARPAPGFVMIYTNTCYAAGAPELWMPPAAEYEARLRVENYSRPMFELGASAYFASDYNGSAARLVAGMLADPAAPFGELFAADVRFSPEALARLPHRAIPDAEVWLHRAADDHGRLDYWYAFAGDSRSSLAGLSAWTWPHDDRVHAPLPVPLNSGGMSSDNAYPSEVWSRLPKGFDIGR
jgi:hypothetical protein